MGTYIFTIKKDGKRFSSGICGEVWKKNFENFKELGIIKNDILIIFQEIKQDAYSEDSN